MTDTEPLTRTCNICQPAVQPALDEGLSGVVRAPAVPERFKGPAEAPTDYLCPACSSRARTRTFAFLISQARAFLPSEGHALLVAGLRHEQRLLRKRFARLTHVSLQGDLGDPGCIVGTDIRAMPDAPSSAFDLAAASAVLDHVPELDRAFAEIQRVLKPGGVFVFHIAPGHILYDPAATVRVRPPRETAAGVEPALPTCSFGRGFIEASARAAGFEVQAHDLRDPVSDLVVGWWLARKPLAVS